MSPFDDQILQQKQLLRTPSKEDYLGAASPKRNESSKEIGNSGNGTAMWLATTTTEQTKSRYQEKAERDQETKLDFDIPDPPLEYCEGGRKGVGDNGDTKRGILSSLFDKVSHFNRSYGGFRDFGFYGVYSGQVGAMGGKKAIQYAATSH